MPHPRMNSFFGDLLAFNPNLNVSYELNDQILEKWEHYSSTANTEENNKQEKEGTV